MEQTIAQLPPLFLFAAYTVFWGWEAFYAARPRPGQRGRRAHNLALSAICIVIAAASGAAVLWLSAMAAREHWGLMQGVELPATPACIAGLILLDLTDYLRHRLSHAVPLLWNLHRVHHSDLAVDVTTSLRNHPIEILLRPLFIGVTIVAFGIAPLAVLLQPLGAASHSGVSARQCPASTCARPRARVGDRDAGHASGSPFAHAAGSGQQLLDLPHAVGSAVRQLSTDESARCDRYRRLRSAA